jgi:hypothetical protein
LFTFRTNKKKYLQPAIINDINQLRLLPQNSILKARQILQETQTLILPEDTEQKGSFSLQIYCAIIELTELNQSPPGQEAAQGCGGYWLLFLNNHCTLN